MVITERGLSWSQYKGLHVNSCFCSEAAGRPPIKDSFVVAISRSKALISEVNLPNSLRVQANDHGNSQRSRQPG